MATAKKIMKKTQNIEYITEEDESSNGSTFNNDEYYDTDDDFQSISTRTSCKRLRNNNNNKKNQNGVSADEFHNNSNNKNLRIERLPTRRPDPKVFNRNALLARENRRKKKEEMEKMEAKFNVIKSENKHMKDLMKQQGIIIKKLTSEKIYLRSVISNRTEILSLLKTIKPTNIPMTSSASNYKTDNPMLKPSTTTTKIIKNEMKLLPESPPLTEDDNGTVTVELMDDPFLSPSTTKF